MQFSVDNPVEKLHLMMRSLKKVRPMKKMNLNFDSNPFDDEERETMESLDKAFEDGTLVSHLSAERQAELQQAARNTFSPPKKHISARLPERDL